MLGRERALSWVLVTTVIVIVVGAGSAAAGSTLRVDAGSSRQAQPFDAQLPVEGEVFGGEKPLNVTWTIDDSTERFEDPHDRSTTVNLSGLTGTVQLTLTVRDAAGDVASDDVLYHVPTATRSPVDRNLTVGPGAPDEIVGASGTDQGNAEVNFTVPSEADLIVARLSWQEAAPGLVVARNDLDLVLLDPSASEVNGGEGRSPGHPETVSVDDPTAGNWTARIEAFLTSPEDARLRIHFLDTEALPDAKIRGPITFGVEDVQDLHATPGVEEATGAWDLDNDGQVDTTGDTATLDAPAGNHTVRYRATTPDGFESVTSDTVRVVGDAEHAVSYRCGVNPLWDEATAEVSRAGEVCFQHVGHHTYTLDRTVEVVGGIGNAFSVEQQFSPPTEFKQAPFETPVHLEVSQDGINWTRLHDAEYQLLEDPREGSIGLDTRQRVTYEFDADGVDARLFRIHQPRSSAEGLSGFLDGTRGVLLVNDTHEASTPATTQGSVNLSCEDRDVLEDFFEDHPCWFGGLNRFDAPSFFHTYRPGPGTTVSSAEATVQVAPWRSDDWFIPLRVPVALDPGATPPAQLQPEDVDRQVNQTTQTRVFLQTSPDGRNWTTIGAENVLFGERTTFQVSLEEPRPARFVRLVPDVHPLFDQPREEPALHHPEAFFLFSEVTVTGQVPAGG